MSTIDLRPRLKRRARQRPPATAPTAAGRGPAGARLITLGHHESGRWLALDVLLRGRDAGPPFALRDEHSELRLTIGQLEHLVLAAGPAALTRYRQQEAALLARELDEEPPAPPPNRSWSPSATTERAAALPPVGPACASSGQRRWVADQLRTTR